MVQGPGDDNNKQPPALEFWRVGDSWTWNIKSFLFFRKKKGRRLALEVGQRGGGGSLSKVGMERDDQQALWSRSDFYGSKRLKINGLG